MTNRPRSTASERWLSRHLRRYGWHRKHGTIRRRVYDLASSRKRWWDWGDRLMALTGTDFGGSWDEPRPHTWYYLPAPPVRMARTGYPRRRYRVIVGYDAFKALAADESEWRAIYVNQDGDLGFGRQYWGEGFSGLDYAERAIVAKYLRRWRMRDWLGLRTWLYLQGLHAAVHVKRPGGCHAVPPKGQGGYDQHCALDKGHEGAHRYKRVEWTAVAGHDVMTRTEGNAD